jgi:Ca2+-binding RTX toxin-like protein
MKGTVMALQIIDTNQIGISTTAATIDLTGADDVMVLAGVNVTASGYNAISGGGDTHSAYISGQVAALFTGVFLGAVPGVNINNAVTVAASGSITADLNGISLWGAGGMVLNEGRIYAGSFGVTLSGQNVTTWTKVQNTGTIYGEFAAIGREANATEKLYIENYGTLSGDSYSFYSYGATAQETIVNRGRMIGWIDMNGGDDFYDGRGGVVYGQILGGAGNDTFFLGAAEEIINGGAGSDTIDLSGSRAVRVALNGTFDATGRATDDALVSIENVVGSATLDVIMGNAAANRLDGGRGADVVGGVSGADTLIGGAGVDTLTGGLGSDQFQFKSASEGGDRILDFTNSATQNDAFAIVVAGFGAGLVAGGALATGLFDSGADNLAGDPNDRFIFRTTDKTLWFDADGTGIIKVVLIADLQATAVVTAADILLV